jgi:hypothetical protein
MMFPEKLSLKSKNVRDGLGVDDWGLVYLTTSASLQPLERKRLVRCSLRALACAPIPALEALGGIA